MPEIQFRNGTATEVAGSGEYQIIQKLRTGIQRSRTIIADFCKTRKTLINAMVGHNYGKVGGPTRPINNMQFAVTTLLALLAPDEARAEVSSPYLRMAADAYAFQLATNTVIGDLRLQPAIRRAVVDAMFAPVIWMVGIQEGGALYEEYDAGKLYVEDISLEDWRCDPRATQWEDLEWYGNRFEMSRDLALESEVFQHIEDLQTGITDKRPDSAKDLATDTNIDARFSDRVTAYNLYMPPGNPVGGNVPVIVTIAPAGQGDQFLRVVEWRGPEAGCYGMLSFCPVPDSVMPLPPGYAWEEMDSFVNELGRKLLSRNRNEKEVILYALAAAKEAETIKVAEDQDMIGTLDAKNFNVLKLGGASAELYNAVEWGRRTFSQLARNIEQMGGVGTMGTAPTATEVSTLQSNAGDAIKDMRGCVGRFLGWAFHTIAWFIYTDPSARIPISYEIEGIPEASFQETFNPSDLQGDFFDYAFTVAAESLEKDSPDMVVKKLLLWAQTIGPMLPLAAEQGAQLNVSEFAKRLGEQLRLKGVHAMWMNAVPTTIDVGPIALRSERPQRQPSRTIPGGTGTPQAGVMAQRSQQPKQSAMSPAVAGGGMR